MKDAVEKAIDAAGSAVKLGRALGITSQAIGQWKKIPAERVVEIERVTGVPRQELRPDLYAVIKLEDAQ